MIFNLGGGAAAPVLTSIAVTTQPTKKTYNVGETFSKSGMVVTAYFDDGSSSVVTAYTYSPTSALTMSTKTITVSYTHEGVTKIATLSIAMQYLLYNAGTEYVPMSTAYGTKGSSSIYVRITGEAEGMAYTTNKINLSGCTTLKGIVSAETGDGYRTVSVGLKSSTSGSFVASKSHEFPYYHDGSKPTLSVSVSSYSGSSYYVVASSETVNGGWYLHKLWLE